MSFRAKCIFEKNAFFDPKIGLFTHKIGQIGVHWVVYGVDFGFLRVPDPLGVKIMQVNFFVEKNFFWPFLAQKGLRKILGLGPKKMDQNRPKWAK